jgi:hypothetical protein
MRSPCIPPHLRWGPGPVRSGSARTRLHLPIHLMGSRASADPISPYKVHSQKGDPIPPSPEVNGNRHIFAHSSATTG